MFCFHKWKVHSVFIAPSYVDKLKQAGFNSVDSISPFMLDREKIVVLRCSKCRMIKQIKMDESATIMHTAEDIICGSVIV